MWDRDLLGSLFEFDYVWELFVPPAKRRWGWYVLPMLFGDRLVGRIEPRIDRAAGRVQVLDLWWEDGFVPGRTEGFVDAMRDALRAYLRFGSATRIEWAPELEDGEATLSHTPLGRTVAQAAPVPAVEGLPGRRRVNSRDRSARSATASIAFFKASSWASA